MLIIVLIVILLYYRKIYRLKGHCIKTPDILQIKNLKEGSQKKKPQKTNKTKKTNPHTQKQANQPLFP